MSSATAAPPPPPTLRADGITKRYPGVLALEDVALAVAPGEVHALIGENGAGKSTMMKILFGVVQPDAGRIELSGRPVSIPSPQAAQALGISMVHQELNLVPALDVARNVFLGREPGRGFGSIDWPRLYREAGALLQGLGIRLAPRAPVRRLSTAQKQLVEIARALSWRPRLLILDEPTSSLSQHEIGELFRILRDLRARGTSILYISHRLEELAEIADRVTVFRDGRLVGTAPATTGIPELVRMMVGRGVDQQFPRIRTAPGEEVLRVEGLSRGRAVRGVSFSVRAGEIVGLAGLVGSGRTETARLLFGADTRDAGAVFVRGRAVTAASPAGAIAAGIALLPEDRKLQGLVLPLPVANNISLATLRAVSVAGVVDGRKRDRLARRFVEALRIRTPGIRFRVRNLSGGNQQKVVLAKWLAAEPSVIVFDEPTRGIDVGAKVEVYGFMNQLTARGAAVVLISSELPEVLGMSDRVLVMHEGRLVGDLPRERATPELVIALASGEADPGVAADG